MFSISITLVHSKPSCCNFPRDQLTWSLMFTISWWRVKETETGSLDPTERVKAKPETALKWAVFYFLCAVSWNGKQRRDNFDERWSLDFKVIQTNYYEHKTKILWFQITEFELYKFGFCFSFNVGKRTLRYNNLASLITARLILFYLL